jgi:N-acyl-aromatic-L-amino acid amidohydrolase
MSLNQIRRVAIAGGTHGNELTGIYLIKRFENLPNLIQRSSFETVTFIANPKAYEIGKRYLDTDLNRCFLKQDLANPALSTYEAKRALEISQIFGIGGSLEADFIVDLHTTTSNMGLTVILRGLESHYIEFAAYLQSMMPEIKILSSLISNTENSHLDSISEFGCTVEVGAIAQNILDARLFQETEELIYLILDYLEACNQKKEPKVANIPVIYQVTHSIDYPRNKSGEIQAMVHPDLQFRDYESLYPGKPIFVTLEGEEILYEGESIVYPVFINEAAYYEKGIAMCICRKLEISQELRIMNRE